MFNLTHPVNFPCGRKPEHPEKTHDFRQSVDRLFSHVLDERCLPWQLTSQIPSLVSHASFYCSFTYNINLEWSKSHTIFFLTIILIAVVFTFWFHFNITSFSTACILFRFNICFNRTSLIWTLFLWCIYYTLEKNNLENLSFQIFTVQWKFHTKWNLWLIQNFKTPWLAPWMFTHEIFGYRLFNLSVRICGPFLANMKLENR